MKIGVIGIGAIGSVISLSLQELNELFYFNRSQREKLSVEHNSVITNKEIVLSGYKLGEKLDWLIICLKEYHIEGAISSIIKLIHPDIKIAVIRNGLDLKSPYLNYMDEENILECIIDCPTQINPNGGYIQYKIPQILTSVSKNLVEFKSLFQKSRIEINDSFDFHTEKWKKIVESSSLGGLLTVMNDTCKVFQDTKTLALYKKIVEEGINVAVADGADIHPNFKDSLMNKLHTYPSTKGSSMLTDRINGRPIEWKAKNGIISKIGKQKGIKTDLNDLLCVLLRRINI